MRECTHIGSVLAACHALTIAGFVRNAETTLLGSTTAMCCFTSSFSTSPAQTHFRGAQLEDLRIPVRIYVETHAA